MAAWPRRWPSAAFASDGLSAEIALEGALPAELALFGETGARAVVSTPETLLARLHAIAAQYGVVARVIGRVTRGDFRLSYNGATVIRDSPATLRAAWNRAIEHDLFGERIHRNGYS